MLANPLTSVRFFEELQETRLRTLGLVELADDAELRTAVHPDISPVGWHLGHVAAFEETWVLQQAHGQPPLASDMLAVFNPLMNPKHRRSELPPREAILAYVHEVRAHTLDRLLVDLDHGSENSLRSDLYVYGLVAAHEQQHVETIAMGLRLRSAARRQEARSCFLPNDDLLAAAAPCVEHCLRGGWVRIGEDDRLVGYDNERPSCEVELAPFAIDARPVTHAEWLVFVNEGGYRRPEWWTPEGWRWRESERIEHPSSWIREGAGWTWRSMVGDLSLPLSHPVDGVSAFEAEAYARFVGKRLPSEAEWEHAARVVGTERPHAGLFAGGTRPVTSCSDFLGNVWEWTSSHFAPYPGFRPEPYPEYSEPWFDGRHRVLRGGSWATQGRMLRPSFRNWFEPHWRLFPMGLRCARSL